MPSHPSPSSSVQAARRRLADRLRDIRADAGLTGRQLAMAAGWHPSKVSRIEHATQAASADDVRAWCAACGADKQAPDLIASLRVAEGAYVEWRRLHRAGLRRLQESYVPLYERTQWFRSYQSLVIPGLLQTTDYATALMKAINAHYQVTDDAEAGARARQRRSAVLYSGRRFAFLLEEAVLRTGVGGRRVMAEQLAYLRTAMSLPPVSVGIIPARPDRTMWPLEGFMIFDTEQVQVEILTARVTVTAPGELSGYLRAYETLSKMAVYGDQAADLIAKANTAL